MHPASVFHWGDRAAMLRFVGERAFATLVAVVDGRHLVAQAPLLVDGDRILLHLSRGNPLARMLPVSIVAVVSGPDAYVSPDWYAEHDQVPTWNYVSVELEGELAATDDAMLREILERQSAIFEDRIPGKIPWTLGKLGPTTLAAKLKGIIGATLAIESMRGTRKLSQNRSDADRAGVSTALSASARDADRAIAALIRYAETH
jgi:transcriptional regulator